MYWRTCIACAVLILAGCDRMPGGGPPGRGTDYAPESLPDTQAARQAVHQYLHALRDRDYDRASFLFTGDWREVAAHVLDAVPDTLTFAGFLRATCGSGYFRCDLELRRVVEIRPMSADTLELVVEFTDSTGRRFSWGPCCGGSGPRDTASLIRAMPRDSGYGVSSLPLYIP